MKRYMILVLVGKDRPGIVDDVSTFLFDRGANIEDSRMAAMGGSFSSMILFSCSPEDTESLKSELDHLRRLGFDTTLHDAEDPSAVRRQAALPLRIHIRAMDHPGIVQKVSRILRSYDVNIESLSTEVTKAPLSGAPLFDFALEASIPWDKPINTVKDELTELANSENLDLSFK